ncbi:hypothetical protein FKM82_009927 [Ascaphus truei]
MFQRREAMCLGLLCLGLLRITLADMYSSMMSIQQALTTEGVLLQHLETYIEQETYRLNDLRRFYEKVHALHQVPNTPVADPILAYTLLKRLQSEWMNVIHSPEANDNTQALKNGYEKLEKNLPDFDDLEGAARALMRLQDVYSLSVKGLVKGIFQRGSSSDLSLLYSSAQLSTMSADDCFQIGKVAYDMEDYYHSIPWLEEAVSLFRGSYGSWFTEDKGSLEDALDYLAFSYYKTSQEQILYWWMDGLLEGHILGFFQAAVSTILCLEVFQCSAL